MSRKEIRRKQTSTSVAINLLDTLEKLANESRIPKSKLYDEALELLFEKHGIEIVEDNQ